MEIEVKVPVQELEPIRNRALELAWPLMTPRHFEANTIYDYPDRSLGAAGCLLRVRETPRGGLITFKGKLVHHDQYKIRPERETWCEDAEGMAHLSRDELASLFDYGYYLRYVDVAFRRLGLS